MRRKTWLAWLALLGLCPGLASAQQTMIRGSGGASTASHAIRVAEDSASEWTSLSDGPGASPISNSAAGALNTEAANPGAAPATMPYESAAFPGGCDACSGLGCGDCGPCYDACDTGMMGGLRRWSNPDAWGMWMDVEYLLWRLPGNFSPPLVTTAPPGVLPTFPAGAGVAFGNDDLDDDFRSGGRIRFGNWIDDTQSIGVEGHFFTFEDTTTNVTFAQPGEGAPSVGVPFLSVNPLVESAVVLALDTPGVGFANAGGVNIRTSSDVYSAGGLIRQFVAEDTGIRVDALAGYRFFRLDEGLVISGATSIGPNNPNPFIPVGTVISFQDLFDVENEFHGGELGMVLERDFGDMLSVELYSKVALGNVRQTVRMDGANSVAFGGASVNTPGGLFVQPTNTGSPMARATFERDEFAFLPEVNIKLGLQITSQTRLTAGWSVLYLDNVLRSGEQIDRAVNPTQIGGGALVGPARPNFAFRDDDMWLYGVSFGVESSY